MLNVIGLNLDNTSVNVGRSNDLYRKFEAKNDVVYLFAKHAAEAFSSVIGFDIGDFLYYFDNTNKRQVLLQEFCEFCD